MGEWTFRPGRDRDIPEVLWLYDSIFSREEETGVFISGWGRGVYPLESDVRQALDAGDLYVLERAGRLAAAGRINHHQVAEYAGGCWAVDAPPEKTLVLHTLVADAALSGQGVGARFVRCYEQLARDRGCPWLRLDTSVKNVIALALYKKLGYQTAGVIPFYFPGIGQLYLQCFEKSL